MGSKNTRKNRICLVCESEIPKDRQGSSVTCNKRCSRIFLRVHKYVTGSINSRHITENKILKEKLESYSLNTRSGK